MINVKEQTYEEKLEMYMKCSKKELAKMLISANNHIDNLCKIYVDYSKMTLEEMASANKIIHQR